MSASLPGWSGAVAQLEPCIGFLKPVCGLWSVQSVLVSLNGFCIIAIEVVQKPKGETRDYVLPIVQIKKIVRSPLENQSPKSDMLSIEVCTLKHQFDSTTQMTAFSIKQPLVNVCLILKAVI